MTEERSRSVVKRMERDATEAIAGVVTGGAILAWDRVLDSIEEAGAGVAERCRDDKDVEAVWAEIERAESEAAREAAGLLGIASRDKAAWVVRRIIAARLEDESVTSAYRRERKRVERRLERYEEIFNGALKLWAQGQKRDTKTSIRMPEAGARLELRAKRGGANITDSKVCCDAAIERFGLFEASMLGLVRMEVALDPTAVKEYVERTKETWAGVDIDEAGETLVIVRVKPKKEGSR